MILLHDWYDRRITVRLPGDVRIFETKIMWVHDLPPQTVFVHDVEFVSHVSPEWKDVSLVFIWEALPAYFRTIAPRCINLDVSTGEWFIVGGCNKRILIQVEQVPE